MLTAQHRLAVCPRVQVVDDILDFTQTAEQLGKPQGQDLASGNLTAPVIFALQTSKELEEIIQSEPPASMRLPCLA